jgi:hypothetical protein
MRWIFKYNDTAKKHIERILKTKIKVPAEPWLHIAVKTVSQRNPWAGYVIFVWDTREVVGEYRSNKGLFISEQFTKANSGMSRALDNRQPLKGGRNKDTNEFFEFGDFDASKSDVFDGAGRAKDTELYKRRTKNKGGNENYFVGLEATNEIDDLNKFLHKHSYEYYAWLS